MATSPLCRALAWIFVTEREHLADSHDLIRVRGARENNLKDVSLDIPKRRLTVFTGVSGETVPVAETVESFEAIVRGDLDDVPEQAFLNVGGMDDVLAKAKTL